MGAKQSEIERGSLNIQINFKYPVYMLNEGSVYNWFQLMLVHVMLVPTIQTVNQYRGELEN